ncbi:hypothetical protein CcrColossus_gp293 [Caulobacter phage CcrColossus]|uniref:Uncharacterized protein n=1 Tax=Caulobacter phage CcrColossus TaxID=1211640 RepID=K4JW87_9CAUD|nr:hypothetical protein CcrColossus_gp293 [Caulobacter phage CcrColossus]AFU88163.1 hypothetical protein CcrColossus_gp293 [Caulobacter phage CcrColossus]
MRVTINLEAFMSLFKITQTTKTVSYPSGIDGQCFSTEEGAQAHRAEAGAVKALGRAIFDDTRTMWCFTTLRNMTEMPVADLVILRDLMDQYLINVLPAFMALEGPFGYGLGKKQIETSDGRSFDNRHEAALHTLEMRFAALFKSPLFSDVGRRAICNISKYSDITAPHIAKELTVWHFTRRLMDFFKRRTEAGNPMKGYEQRFRDALDAMVVARTTPIEPIVRTVKPKKAA